MEVTENEREIIVTMPKIKWGIDPDFEQCQCTCKKCGNIAHFDFLVDDIVWYGVTSDYWKSVGREDGYMCMNCFDELAAEKDIRYTPHTIIFIGRQCSFTFAKQTASHINGSEW